MSGRLIAFEGADASGKSTQAHRLARRLGLPLTFQFGATDIGGSIRGILLDPEHRELDDRAEALLVVADKAQHVARLSDLPWSGTRRSSPTGLPLRLSLTKGMDEVSILRCSTT